jgi:hypothetical protein
MHEFLWRTVGQGKIVALTDHTVEVSAQVSLAVYRGDLNIRFALLDRNDDAITGPCRLQLNSLVDENALYKMEDDGLSVSSVLSGESVHVKFAYGQHNNRTECRVVSPLDLTVYVEPAAT